MRPARAPLQRKILGRSDVSGASQTRALRRTASHHAQNERGATSRHAHRRHLQLDGGVHVTNFGETIGENTWYTQTVEAGTEKTEAAYYSDLIEQMFKEGTAQAGKKNVEDVYCGLVLDNTSCNISAMKSLSEKYPKQHNTLI